jgi:UDP-GlcNAc:undecaprenyl-phosphate GlcNAc-1-phosphate transferase
MGDAGSLFLGFTLACLTMTTRFYQVGEGQTLLRLAMPVLIMGLPLFDTASVMWIRLREGRPLMQGDRSHFSHRLAALGMSVREAVLTNYLVAAVTGLGATLLIYVDATGGAVILAQAFIVLSLVALLERTGRRKP